jgi:hypothetical protein
MPQAVRAMLGWLIREDRHTNEQSSVECWQRGKPVGPGDFLPFPD